jgi:hypothetical protein
MLDQQTIDNIKRLSPSKLKRFIVAPAKVFQPYEATPAMEIGTAGHTYVLERFKFLDTVVCSEYNDYRTKEAKKWKESNELAGKIVLKSDDYRMVVRMGDNALTALNVHGFVQNQNYDTEVWLPEAPYKSLTLNGRVDIIRRDKMMFGDVKFVADITKERRKDYEVQMGFYRLMLSLAHHIIPDKIDCFLLLCEKKPPYMTKWVDYSYNNEDFTRVRSLANAYNSYVNRAIERGETWENEQYQDEVW